MNKNQISSRPLIRKQHRPWWQRLVLPVVGLALVSLGIVGWILPIIPGIPVILIGLPLLCCFDAQAEKWAEDRVNWVYAQIKRIWRKQKGS